MAKILAIGVLIPLQGLVTGRFPRARADLNSDWRGGGVLQSLGRTALLGLYVHGAHRGLELITRQHPRLL